MSAVFAEGDLVEATKGERRVIDRVVAYKSEIFTSGPYLGNPNLFTPSSIESYKSLGYTLTLVEKAAAILPTEPGTVITWMDGAYLPQLAQLDSGSLRLGWRYNKDVTGDWYTPSQLGIVIDGQVVTVLEPVAETAKKVLDRVLEEYGTLPLRFVADVLPIVAKEFGVTS